MQVEILALRHQLAVYQRTAARPKLRPADRILWAWLSRAWSGWREALVIVKPETVIVWRRRKFRQHWARLCRSGKPGRPSIPREVRDLIRRVSSANPLWGAPRIVGELAKIGIHLPRSTVAKYMIRHRRPPSATWRTFLKNHVRDIVAVDFFVVPTVRNQVLFVFLVLAHERRRVLTDYFEYSH
ncbi:MAG: integrase, partial [Candidatus Eisenbacteria bacterium]|nr:integrase [Candidatus Eisenbacteria bacterium]